MSKLKDRVAALEQAAIAAGWPDHGWLEFKANEKAELRRRVASLEGEVTYMARQVKAAEKMAEVLKSIRETAAEAALREWDDATLPF